MTEPIDWHAALNEAAERHEQARQHTGPVIVDDLSGSIPPAMLAAAIAEVQKELIGDSKWVWSRYAHNAVEHIAGPDYQPICGARLHPERLIIRDRPSGLANRCSRCLRRHSRTRP